MYEIKLNNPLNQQEPEPERVLVLSGKMRVINLKEEPMTKTYEITYTYSITKTERIEGSTPREAVDNLIANLTDDVDPTRIVICGAKEVKPRELQIDSIDEE